MSNDDKTKNNKDKNDDKSKKRNRKEMDGDDNEIKEPPKKKTRRSRRINQDIPSSEEDFPLLPPVTPPKKKRRVFKKTEDKRTNTINDDKEKTKLEDFFSIILQGPFMSPSHPPFLDEDKEDDIEEIIEEDYEEDKGPEEYIDEIDINKLKTLDGLIELADKYTDFNNKDMKILVSLKEELKELNKLIGMKDIKGIVASQVIFLIQRYDDADMMHTVIQGPPGCGKTTLAKIMAKIYLKLGYVKNNKFIKAKRSDLIAGYLGQTAIKTQKMIDRANGGVLFIDEAYSLGPGKNSNGDSFSKECIDTLNQNLSENKNFICIIAGYKDDLMKCFFKNNEGLERRFPWKFDIKEVDHKQLKHIFISMVRKNDWDINTNEIPFNFFKTNRDYFPFNGGSIETFFGKVKMVHSKRVFGKSKKEKMKITKDDILQALKVHKEVERIDERLINKPPTGMYI